MISMVDDCSVGYVENEAGIVGVRLEIKTGRLVSGTRKEQ